MLGNEILEEDLHCMTEDNRIGDLHHRRLHVKGEKDSVRLGLGNLALDEGDERLFTQHRGVEDFTCLERGFFLENLSGAIGFNKLDLHIRCGRHGDRFFIGKEIILSAHRPNARLGIGAPGTHGMRMFTGVLLDGLGGAAIRVSLAEYRIDGASLDLVVAGPNLLLGLGGGVVGIVGQFVALGLKFGEGGLQLRH